MMKMRRTFFIKQQYILFCLTIFFSSYSIFAQENPPIPVTVEVNTSQFLNFGSFTTGPGMGTVTVDHNSTRTHTGDVFLLNVGESPSAALFDVTANPGTIIQITAPTNILLKGTNGGEIYMDINSFSAGQTFITIANPPGTNPIYVGGTLRIGSETSAPPGKYHGTFTLTFNHQ